jgi:hypothetical protein
MKSVVLPACTSMSVVRNNFTAIAVHLVDFQEFRYKDHAIGCHPTGPLGVAITLLNRIREVLASNIGLTEGFRFFFLSPSRKAFRLGHDRFLPNLF